MSENNSVGLALCAEVGNLFQDFSTNDESTIAGGGGHGHHGHGHGHKHGKKKKKCHLGKIGKRHCHSYHWYKKNKHHFKDDHH